MVSDISGIQAVRPEIIGPTIPSLKTLVAEYLFDLYGLPETIESANFHEAFSVLVGFLAWEEKRRTAPRITTRDDTSAGKATTFPGILQYGESTKP